MFKKIIISLTILAVALSLSTTSIQAADVVASTPELAAIAKEVGGNKVSVHSIAPPNRDYHAIEPRPSDVARIRSANLVVRTGLSMDMWMDALLNAARNPKLNRGAAGYVDASAGIPTIDKPTGAITGASGDVHPEGNPHYFYDPIYAKFAARNIVRGLIRVDAANAEYYRARYAQFNQEIDRRMNGWRAQLSKYQGQPVVTYHQTYGYFMRRFGIYNFGQMESRPGIPPSASHINNLIERMKRGKVKAVVVESIYPNRWPEFIKRQTGVNYVVAPYSVAGTKEGEYFAFMDRLVNSFARALS